MKVITYEELLAQPSGTVCAAYYDNMLGDVFVIGNQYGEGFSYVKYLTPCVRDGIFLTWEYTDDNYFEIGEEYGKGLYAILDKSDIKTIIRELDEW